MGEFLAETAGRGVYQRDLSGFDGRCLRGEVIRGDALHHGGRGHLVGDVRWSPHGAFRRHDQLLGVGAVGVDPRDSVPEGGLGHAFTEGGDVPSAPDAGRERQ